MCRTPASLLLFLCIRVSMPDSMKLGRYTSI